MIPMIILSIENADDRDFMARLYIKYYPLMRKKAYEVTGSYSNVEDLIHDTIVELIDEITTLRALDERRLASYIVTAMRNININHIKKKNALKRKHTKEAEEAFYNIDSAGISVEDSFINKDTYRQLGEAINRLPEKERAVLTNKYLLGKSNDEIAKLLGMSPKSIYTYIARAKAKIKEILEEEDAHTKV